jgi:hypothetical protein
MRGASAGHHGPAPINGPAPIGGDDRGAEGLQMPKSTVARNVRTRVRSTPPGADVPLWAGEGRGRFRLLRKAEALEVLATAGLDQRSAEYHLTRASREGRIRAVAAHAHSWLFAEDDVQALADELIAEAALQDDQA